MTTLVVGGGGGLVVWLVLLLLAPTASAATGTGSYRIRSRPPSTSHQQRTNNNNNNNMNRNDMTTGWSPSSSSRNWQDVYIAGFLALSDHEIEAPLGQGVMPAITLALRHLANSTFLHDYRLRLLYNDTQVLLLSLTLIEKLMRGYPSSPVQPTILADRIGSVDFFGESSLNSTDQCTRRQSTLSLSF